MPTKRKCPSCDFETEDEKIRFCPTDGTKLVEPVVWYDAFISYRHKDGKFAAQAIRASLQMHRGMNVFVDVNELRSGVFDEALLTKIEVAPNFILVLSEDSLDRCQNEGDWLRREIVHALKHGRHIIPVLLDGFEMPKAELLPADIRELTRWQAVRFDDTFPDGSYRRIGEWCKLESKEAPARASSGPTTGTPVASQPVGPDLGHAASSRAGVASRAEVNAQPQLPGGLVVLTEPAGAEVQVGGAELATSPATIRNLPPREYMLTLMLEGYETVETSVVVASDKFTRLPPFKLVRQVGSLVIGSKPAPVDWVFSQMPAGPECKVKQGKGKTPEVLEDVPTGNYVVEFRRAGWPTVVKEVCVEPDRTAEVEAAFIGGSLTVSSEPSGAEIVRDGTVIGTTPQTWSDLVPGAVKLDLHCAGYNAATVSGRIEARQNLRLAAELEKFAGPEVGRPATIPDLKLELVPISEGSFVMGSMEGEPDERPVTQVHITGPFWLGKYAVIQEQWEVLMGRNPSQFKGENLPVEQVSYDNVLEFCRKLTARERAAGRLPSGYEYTLPTEAQWEYACRAGTTGKHAGDLESMGWYAENSRGRTHPVGQKKPNDWGLYDMHGNVWEWCLDWYSDRLPGGTIRDPSGPRLGSYRVSRGGGWNNAAGRCRSADRDRSVPGYRNITLGFRLALSAVP